jgi:galactose-1-phosphate uridylyltransferase
MAEIAGFELSSGIFVNTMAPEDAAVALRARSEPGPEEQEPPLRT